MPLLRGPWWRCPLALAVALWAWSAAALEISHREPFIASVETMVWHARVQFLRPDGRDTLALEFDVKTLQPSYQPPALAFADASLAAQGAPLSAFSQEILWQPDLAAQHSGVAVDGDAEIVAAVGRRWQELLSASEGEAKASGTLTIIPINERVGLVLFNVDASRLDGRLLNNAVFVLGAVVGAESR